MARLTTPDVDDLDPAGQAVRKRILESRGEIAGPFTALLHSPEVADRIAAVGAFARFESPLPPDLRCLAILLVARTFECDFQWAAWVPQALDAGVPAAVVDAIRDNERPQDLTAEQSAVYDFCRELLESHRVSPSAYDRVRALLDVRLTVDLVAVMGYFAMISFALNAFEVGTETGP